MPAIYPIATSRVSDSLIQARLISQFEFDNQELARLQDQVSTGYRISTPSQDAPAAIRAITLQRWLEQKEQAKVNLETTNSFISASDTALTGATDLLNYVQSVALSAIDTTATVEQRRVLRTEVERALQQFLDIGNRQFRGRYLFAGSQTTTQPFELQGQYVAYRGNLTRLQNFADVDYLSDTNISGADAFGAISAEVRGTADLNPILTESTKLSDLREGRGITRGSIQISDGTHTSIVDLSSATTIRDVIQRIEARPPAGREINVTLSRDGLILQLDDGGGGNLTITEVPGGTTASDLGIYNPTGSGTAPFQGRDLDPRLTLLTRLDQILGSRASARIESAGQSNDIRIEAVQNGAAYNGVTVQFINSAASGDQALASYDAGTQTLTIDVSPDVTRAATVVAAINGTGAFTATLDDKLDALNDGNGLIDVTATAVTSGGAGEDFDAAAGLRIENAGEVHTFNFAGAETIEDLLNILNAPDAGLYAAINSAGNGLDVRTRISGANFAVGENGGRTATQLGLRTLLESTYLAELNFGQGVQPYEGIDFTVWRRDGVTLDIDLSAATTLGDVLDLINNHPANVGNAVTARLAEFGNGIELVDPLAAGSGDLAVLKRGGTAAWQLGLIPHGEDQSVAQAPAAGQPQRLTGRDVHPREAVGIFTSLLRLAEALEADSLPDIQRAAALLDDAFTDLTFVRAGLGGKASNLETLDERIDQEEIQLRTTLSSEIDADLVKSVSDLTARQASLEASLRLVAEAFRLSVLDFL